MNIARTSDDAPPPPTQDRARSAAYSLAATTLVWGSTFVIVRELVAENAAGGAFPPALLLAIRFAIAALLVVVVMFARGIRFSRTVISHGTILGFVTAGGFAFQTIGLRDTTSSRSAFITNVSLLLVPLFGMLMGRARPGPAVWAGCLIALGGLYFLEFPWDAVTPAPNTSESNYLRGDLLTLGCAVFFALQILATEAFSPKHQLQSLVLVQFSVASVLTFILSAFCGELTAPIPAPNGVFPTALMIIYLGAVATGLCLIVQAWAQRYTSATRAALIFMIEPVIATLLAFVILGDRFTTGQWVGAALVFIGILTAELLAGTQDKRPAGMA